MANEREAARAPDAAAAARASGKHPEAAAQPKNYDTVFELRTAQLQQACELLNAWADACDQVLNPLTKTPGARSVETRDFVRSVQERL
jgi:hypothetical protein